MKFFSQPALKGVNIGGWLLLEKWMTPSLFEGLNAVDETTFCLELGSEAEKKLQKHWQTFITQRDFDWVAGCGLQIVRIPIGHWIFGDKPPYVGSIEFLDKAMKMAEKSNLGVIIDLHGAPGSQNGTDHSGLVGKINWHKDPKNIAETLELIEKIAVRYKDSPNLFAIELLNEPAWEIPFDLLADYYKEGYDLVRKHLPKEVAVIFHDGFRPEKWEGFKRDAESLWIDMHIYQCYTPKDFKMDVLSHLESIKTVQQQKIENATLPVLIGEWSLALGSKELQKLSATEQKQALKSFGKVQMEVYNLAAAWTFWNYKLEYPSDSWNFRHAVETGIVE